jgi:hypothetical protein
MTLRIALVVTLLALALPAGAGRPFTTEDANVLDDRRCQVEAWIDRSRVATDSWLVPACNFGGGVEWQLGLGRNHSKGRSAFAEAYAQAKAVYPMPEDLAWDVGLVLGVRHQPGEEHRRWVNPYALVPFSVSPTESLALHANIGTVRDHASRRNLTLWGVAAEVAVREALTLLAEAYSENSRRPFVRLGARYAVIGDKLDFDFTIVSRPGGTPQERFVSVGVTWQSGRFLP